MQHNLITRLRTAAAGVVFVAGVVLLIGEPVAESTLGYIFQFILLKSAAISMLGLSAHDLYRMYKKYFIED